MSWSSVNCWQYSRWVKNIARNMRITNPEGAELAAVRTYLKLIWNPKTQTGTRNWLNDEYFKRASAATADYEFDIDVERPRNLVMILERIGRDLKKVAMSANEKTYTDTLIAATGNRRFGTSPYFGGVGGSIVGVP